MADVAAMLKGIHAQEEMESALSKAIAVAKKVKAMKLPEAAKKIETSVKETLTYMEFPR